MGEKKCDILIIGGGVIGSASAYFLSRDCSPGTRICVVERDTSYAQSSTALSAASIRVQFSNPINVDMSLFGGNFIRTFQHLFSENAGSHRLAFRENGYLFLAGDKPQCQVLRENHATQIARGADVILLEQRSLTSHFPYLNVEDISLASLGQSGEGWFDNMGLLAGLKALAQENGVEYLSDEVVALKVVKSRVVSASLASGRTLRTGDVVNAAGTRASQIAAMAGIELPVEPRKRTTFVLQTP